jgi:hypothetical protein
MAFRETGREGAQEEATSGIEFSQVSKFGGLLACLQSLRLPACPRAAASYLLSQRENAHFCSRECERDDK